MTVGAAVVHPDTTVADAARIILQHRISGPPVVDSEGRQVTDQLQVFTAPVGYF